MIYTRGWVGLAMIGTGLIVALFDTPAYVGAYFIIGLGGYMVASGFRIENNKFRLDKK